MINFGAHVISAYSNILQVAKDDDITKIGRLVEIPRFEDRLLLKLCDEAKQVLSAEPTLLKLVSPIIIVGDLHGSLLDLLRIFANHGPPSESTTYLFLGDYVDRGSYSIETMTLLFAYLIEYPKNTFLLRGNHEFPSVNSAYGFKNEVLSTYAIFADELYNKFNEAFSYMPLAATIDDATFCVHGGLSPEFQMISELSKIQRPIADFNCCPKLISDIMWSDPNSLVPGFTPSLRGAGCFFGEDIALCFLNRNKMSSLVRAHQCVNKGIEILFHSKLATIFSASSYNKHFNKSGILIKNSEVYDAKMFDPLPRLEREKSLFIDIGMPESRIVLNHLHTYSFRSFNGFKSTSFLQAPRGAQNPILKPHFKGRKDFALNLKTNGLSLQQKTVSSPFLL
ncbi:Serine/threonine-protein phosphatase PP1 isozyme 9 [Tritrichomonas foetus]|uniref:Serine/threonine-protein phosphatase n=1 Tax=Tritrichomonas foetus TaxID=1144522 RepID=A0A1J4KSV9_9EUKA|nr:Serine/threonine-protein phosphatase PP1 isozyme 9 [Tritrichomonas foetus]|eukprot:OHT14377.1 Serine/threonine-protein phosphatase PP1 isozyme 9 [Tritrichomonas foetus]